MYIIKNAWRNIVRSKGRNILIGIIIFIISVSLCIGLSIRQAASSARETALESMTITAQISVDRSKMMKNAMTEDSTGSTNSNDSDSSSAKTFDKSKFGGFQDSLSVDELEKYSKASTVKDFYYTITSSLNATGNLEAVTNSSSSSDEASSTETTTSPSSNNEQQGGNMDGKMMQGGENGENSMGGAVKAMQNNGDFSLTGFSSDSAMTDFINGTCEITDGSVFEEGTTDYSCIISNELATYNSLSVGDTITLSNPSNDDETYDIKIIGIYTNSGTEDNQTSSMFSFSDPANEIYMSYNALKAIADKSEKTNEDSEDNQAVFSQTQGTYTFANVDDYDTFAKEVYDLGLSEDYTVSSSDISSFEQSMVPLESLSTISGYFLIVIIIIGALILIVLNIFSVRERKYEIGVLTAIGMKKGKVALQFISEIMIVTLLAVIMGGAVGAISSVPVANALLKTQVTSQQQTTSDRQQAFGRDVSGDSNAAPDLNSMPDNNGPMAKSQVSYVTEINSAVNITVLLQLLAICVLLAAVASAVSVTAIMRYDPLKILSNRD